MEMEQLKHQESQIYGNVLKHSTTTFDQYAIPYDLKQSQFMRTCYAIECIIKNKLYKLTAQNLEQYFLKEFNVSRAQVYRLLDCAAVLRASATFIFSYTFLSFKSLEGMSPLPHKYKICKDLKQKAGLGPECRALWQKVLDFAKASAASSTDENPESATIRESDIENFSFDALPNIVKQKKTANDSNFNQNGDKENSHPNESISSQIYNQNLCIKRKVSEPSITSSSYAHNHLLPITTLHNKEAYARRSSIDSFSPQSYLPPPNRNSPFLRRESNESIRTLVEGVEEFTHNEISRKGSFDARGRPLLPPILSKRRYSEADPRKLRYGHSHEEGGEINQSSRYEGRPPPPMIKKRVSLPGLSSIANSSRANSSTVSSPNHTPSSSVKSYSFAPSYSAPSDPIFQYAKNEMSIRHENGQRREWEVYSHHLSSYQTAQASRGTIKEDNTYSFAQIHPPLPFKHAPIRGDDYEGRQIIAEFEKCQHALTMLSQRGYQLTPMVEGKWFLDHPITKWRIVPSSAIEKGNSKTLTPPSKESSGYRVKESQEKEPESTEVEEEEIEDVIEEQPVKKRRSSVLFDDLVAAAAHESSQADQNIMPPLPVQ